MEGFEMDGATFGDPAAEAQFCVAQTQPEDCVEMSIADVVGQETGHEPSEGAITTLAEDTPSTVNVNPATGDPEPAYNPSAGTPLQDAPELLKDYGVTARYVDDTSATASGAPGTGMGILEQDLASGDKIIASVDGPEIWTAAGDPTDVTDTHTADHAVVVTGVDTTKGIVYLNDSGVPNGGAEAVPVSAFEQAWGTSGDAMVVTEPAAHDDTTTTVPVDPTQATPTPAGPAPSGGYALAEGAGLAAAAGATAAYWANQRKSKNRRGTAPSPREYKALTS
jgi:hypothetical protein